MRICAADAERADSGAARQLVRFPFSEPVVDEEGAPREVDLRVRPLEVKARRQHSMLEREHGLEQSGHAGGGIGVADVRLHRADGAKVLSVRASIAEGLR